MKNWKKELKDKLYEGGFKPIQFQLSNSGVRIINFVDSLLLSQRKELIEEIREEIEKDEPENIMNKAYQINILNRLNKLK